MSECSRCGSTESVKKGTCAACKKAYMKTYYQKNKERIAEVNKLWAEKNREKSREIKKKWSDANPEKQRMAINRWKESNPERTQENRARWYSENKDRLRLHCINRRRKLSGGKITKERLADLFVKQKGKCPICKSGLDKFHIDHIIPIALGGSNTDDNIQLLCPPCNLRKSAKHPVDFMQENGYLI